MAAAPMLISFRPDGHVAHHGPVDHPKSARLLREKGQVQRNRRRLVFNQRCAYG